MNYPLETKCPHCGRRAAEVICSLCKTERREFSEVKRLAEERRVNDYANARIKDDKISPPHNPDGDRTCWGSRLKAGQ